jgi:mono/diheme cytochrome c family protein
MNTGPNESLGDGSDQSLQQVHEALLRNKPEPKDGYPVMPLFLLGLLSALVFVGSIYFLHYRGGLSAMVYDERFDPSTAEKNTAVAQVDPVAAGKRLYNQPGACVTCHQANGLGVPGAFPPLAGSEWVLGSEKRLIRVVLHGLAGEIKVKGTVYNSVMPAFGDGSGFNWNDDKVAHVLTYIRQEWGNTASPVEKSRVTEIRTKGAAGRNKPWTASELDALP